MKHLKKILIAEDERIVAWDIRDKLSALGYNVVAITHSGESAVAAARENEPDLVLMDIRLEGEMDGIEAAEIIRLRDKVPVVYLTSFSDNDTLDRAKLTEPYGYVVKPFEERDLKTTVEIAFDRHQRDLVHLQTQHKSDDSTEDTPASELKEAKPPEESHPEDEKNVSSDPGMPGLPTPPVKE